MHKQEARELSPEPYLVKCQKFLGWIEYWCWILGLGSLPVQIWLNLLPKFVTSTNWKGFIQLWLTYRCCQGGKFLLEFSSHTHFFLWRTREHEVPLGEVGGQGETFRLLSLKLTQQGGCLWQTRIHNCIDTFSDKMKWLALSSIMEQAKWPWKDTDNCLLSR